MFNPTPEMSKKLQDAPRELKKLLADILTESILSSNIPEENKIEVRIMRGYEELDELLSRTVRVFGCPIPPEDQELAKRIYPARQAFLEYLKLMKGGLENFLVNVPAPDIPPRVPQAYGEPV